MKNLEFITQLRLLLIKSGLQVSELEMTSGNYDDQGNLIPAEIPTITTDLCEIGAYDETCYFVIILKSDLFTKELFDQILVYPTAKIYGFNNFHENYYPKENFHYKELVGQIGSEDLMQIQFGFNKAGLPPKQLLDSYFDIKLLFEKQKINVENQLVVDFTVSGKR